MNWTRRDFLSASASALALAGVPRVLLEAAESASTESDQTLVVVQLSGGNDGLNTVIPYDHDSYRKSRPSLRVGKGQVHKIDAKANYALGFHPQMEGFKELFDEGSLAVVPGVGYPNPSRSHFRSMDIWHSAQPEKKTVADGWLGRTIAAGDPKRGGLYIGDSRLPLALTGDVPVPSLQNIDFLDFLNTDRGRRMRKMMRSLNQRERTGGPEKIRSLANGTVSQLERLAELKGKGTPVDYPSSRLAQRLKLTGQLIGGGIPTRVYYVTQGGYDTHALQKDQHANLVGDLSAAVTAFYRHLQKLGRDKNVTVMVFSEFGRRVEENGSRGTDHGAAGPLFVVSGRARSGFHGDYPKLDRLERGDLRFNVDFRRVYATLLDQVLGLPPKSILGPGFEKLDLLG